MYAQVVLGLPVEGPFDYVVPQELEKEIAVGKRVLVNFGYKKSIGFVTAITEHTVISKTKPLLKVLDSTAVLAEDMLLLAKEISRYYCCSWGQAIEAALPEKLRSSRAVTKLENPLTAQNKPLEPGSSLKNLLAQEHILLHDLDGQARWVRYREFIKQAIDENKSVIVLVPDVASAIKYSELLKSEFHCPVAALYRESASELEDWLRVKNGIIKLVVATRSGIFTPVTRLGLVIIDQEHNTVYKQEQSPHYHAREVAFMRSRMHKARVVLGSTTPSLESFYLANSNKIKYEILPRRRGFPEVKVFDTKYLFSKKSRSILTKYLQDSIASVLLSKGKVLLFLNRRGFATYAACLNCGWVLKCPRCNINLVFHFRDNNLRCHYCNYTIEQQQICPECKAGYIKYSGAGIEKIVSELSRLFPLAKIVELDAPEKGDTGGADIWIASQSVIKHEELHFDLIGVLAIDNSLNHIDFRASEKTFGLLAGLLSLTDKKIIIQSALSKHHSLAALLDKDINSFYLKELKLRKQLSFPPYSHFGIIRLRAAKEAKAEQAAEAMFLHLQKANIGKGIAVLAVNPGTPLKLRGNYYWQILLSSRKAEAITTFIKSGLKGLAHSGVIVTVDIDPV